MFLKKQIIILLVITGGIFQTLKAQNYFDLKNGDLIFQESCTDGMSEAIKQSTTGIEGYNFTHIGMVWKAFQTIYVIEATQPQVKITPLQEYLNPGNVCKPHSVVGRVKKEYQGLIPKAVQFALSKAGRGYDDAFDMENDQYYCSELIYHAFKEANQGKEIFHLRPMTFKSLKTNRFPAYWVEHFQRLGIPIPEGKPGNNPGDMSKSELIDIVHYY